MARTGREQRIKAEKEKHFITTAAVSIDLLEFPFSRDLKEENVRSLVTVFSGSPCTPERPEYHVPAIISRATLRNEWFMKNDRELAAHPGVRLQCLRGRHRVTAARRLRQPLDTWVVDIYDSEISDETQQDFVESNDSENPPEDGEFYYKVRLYQGAFGVEKADMTAERRWRSRWRALHNITKGDNDQLKRLLGHPEYLAAFDQLHHSRALYSGMRLGSIHRMLNIGLDPELLFSLYKLKLFWYEVFENDEEEMQKFTITSLNQLQRTAPGACPAQAKEVHVHGFSEFTHNRQKYVENVIRLTKDTLVPSLDTFFMNLNYLQVSLRNCLTRLIKPRTRESFRSAFEETFAHHGQRECWIQIDDEHITSIETDEVFELAYRGLVLFSLRNFDAMPSIKIPRKAGQSGDFADRRVLYQFAVLANKLGFRTSQINGLLCEGPLPQPHTAVSITDEYEGEEEEPRLYGKPNTKDFKRDKQSLFLPQLHCPFGVQETRLSSSFIARSHYFSLFGDKLKTDLRKAGLSERVPLLVASGEYGGTIADIERRNIELEDRAKAMEDLSNRLNARERDLGSLQDKLSTERQELLAQQHELKATYQRLETQQALEAREAKLNAGQQELESQRRLLDEQKEGLNAVQLERIAEQETASKTQAEDLATREEALRTREEEISILGQQQQAQLQSLTDEQRRLDQLQLKLQTKEEKLVNQKKGFKAARKKLAAQKAALNTQEEEISRRGQQQEAQLQLLTAREEQLDELQLKLQIKQEELESWEEVLSPAEADLAAGEAALKNREEALEQGLKIRQQKLDAFQQDLEAHRHERPHLFADFFEARVDHSKSIRDVSYKLYPVFRCSSAYETEQRAIYASQYGWLVYCFNGEGIAEECPAQWCVTHLEQTGHRAILLSREQIPTDELPKLADLEVISLDLKRKHEGEDPVIKRRKEEREPDSPNWLRLLRDRRGKTRLREGMDGGPGPSRLQHVVGDARQSTQEQPSNTMQERSTVLQSEETL